MSQYNNTLELRKYKHLNEKERYRIEILLKEGFKPHEIAQRMGRGIRTIEREIARGSVWLLNHDLSYRKEYCADVGQRIYEENLKSKGPGVKIGKDHKLVKHIEKR